MFEIMQVLQHIKVIFPLLFQICHPIFMSIPTDVYSCEKASIQAGWGRFAPFLKVL